MLFRSLSEDEKLSLPCFKETYLSKRGQHGDPLDERQIKLFREELEEFHLSSQVEEDLITCVLNVNNIAVRSTIDSVSHFINKLK